ncbi:shikimate dehydrogenase [Methanoregula sp. PtaB.Bin085]|uniref:shikimate dehydrogenase n=1 Tax=Methanoregula sp. PtaB.Bin085 TaxID=1811680 RepID=UPI0009D41429|nr:shikimate dehydrogenase [Methanoregula sp. PtaB.Bin085]OPX63459.1 MAG: Shikimate dehydrogenase [Methanoregula sp. PtaB.Bin085]
MKRIVFCGYRGTGKTEVGKIVAEKAGLPFIDTDTLIERQTGRSIPDIFHEDGEERFREEERKVIAGLPAYGAVISTGGGVVTDPANMEHLRKDSTVFVLHADIDTIAERLSRKPRPPLTGLPLREEIAEMMDRRRQHYMAAADYCIDTSGTTPDAAAAKVMDLLAKGTIPAQVRAPCVSFFRTGRIPQKCLDQLLKVLADTPDDPLTRLMGVAGYPCAHSKGPRLFNALFERYGLDYHYTWFEDPELDEIMQVARALDVKGLSVTIPFKQDIIPMIDEIDEHAAQQIGAVNTVVFACGTSMGWNTDWIGVRKPLVDLKGSKAVLLGAGGAAAGAAFAMVDLDMDLTILNRTPAKAKAMAERFGCKWGELSDFGKINPGVVVNSTPLGMNPGDRMPVSADLLHKEMTVFDLVYTPPVTPLIEAARAAGCTTITGTEMFIGQAREQFYLFFGIDVPADTIRELLP